MGIYRYLSPIWRGPPAKIPFRDKAPGGPSLSEGFFTRSLLSPVGPLFFLALL